MPHPVGPSSPNALSAADLVVLFESSVTPGLGEALVAAIRDESRDAADLSSSRYARDQAREAAPRLRRAGLESALLGLPARFPEVQAESLRSSSSTFYVRLDVGGLTLIVARAANTKQMVRQSLYRQRMANSSLQGNLFPEESPEEGRAYGIVLYGGPSSERDPAFVVVRFPTGDHNSYFDASIDLRTRYSHLFSIAAPIEQIEDTQRLSLRAIPTTGTTDTR